MLWKQPLAALSCCMSGSFNGRKKLVLSLPVKKEEKEEEEKEEEEEAKLELGRRCGVAGLRAAPIH